MRGRFYRRMIFKYNETMLIDEMLDITNYGIPVTPYRILIFRTNISVEEFYIFVERARYYCRKYGSSFIAGYSTTSSKDAMKTTIQTGKPGRPKQIITGTEVEPHYHDLFVGNNNQSCWSAVQKVNACLQKRYGKHSTKIEGFNTYQHFCNDVGYVLKQSDILRSYGDFDFAGYYHDRK